MEKRMLIFIFFMIGFSLSGFSQLESVRIEADDSGICQGDSLELRIKVEVEGLHPLVVEWSPNENITSILSDKPYVYPEQTTTYHLSVYDSKYGITLTDTFKVSVVPIPVVKAGQDGAACRNEPFTIVPGHFDTSLDPIWEIISGGGKFEDSNDTITNELTAIYIPETDYLGDVLFKLKGSGIDYCADVCDTMRLSYYGSTTADITSLNDSVCSHERIQINAITENHASWKWRHDGNGKFENENTLSPIYVPDNREFGYVNIFLDVVGFGCDVRDSMTLFISPISIEKMDDFEACEGRFLDVGLRYSDNLTYTWNDGSNDNFIRVQAFTDELFTVFVDNGLSCFFTDSIFMKVLESPEIQLDLDPENLTLVANPSNLNRYAFFGNKNTLLQDSPKNSFYYGDVQELYDTIFVVAYNDLGCSSNEDETYSDYVALPFLKLVDAFSPNADGVNDLLLPGRKIMVIDRTSKILYEGWDGWDGKYKGVQLPQGTYFYIVYDNYGNTFYKGPVTILY